MNLATLNATIGINTNPARASLNSINTSLNLTANNLRLTLNQFNTFGSGASSALGRVRSEAGLLNGTMSTTLGNIASSAVLGGVKMIVGGVNDLVQRGLDYNEVLERAAIGFTTMMGSADKAQAHIKELQKFAATTSFDFKGLVQNSQFLQAMGFDAKQIIPVLTSVGDALGAAGRPEALDRVLLQLGQMKSKGKVMASEINLIAEAGIPVWKILSEQVGKSVKELQQLGEQGKLNSDVFQELLFRGMDQKYGGAMALASQTRSGLMSNLQDELDRRSGQATTGLNEQMKRSINSTREFLSGPGGEALAKSMNTASTVVGIAFNEVLSKLVGSGDFIAKATTIGGDVVNGLSDGIVQTTEKVKAAASGTATTVLDTFKNIFQVQSPSRVMFAIGQDVAQGFIEGIESKQAEIIATMAKVVGERGAQSLVKKGVMFGPGFFTSGNAEWDKAIAEQSKAKGLDPAVMFAQLLQESRFNPNAKSPAGAEGLAQFMPGTAKRFNLANPYDPIESIRANADYMRELLSKFNQFGNATSLALAGYNAGENRDSLRAGRIPNIRETQDYVKIITSVRDMIGKIDVANQTAANEFSSGVSIAMGGFQSGITTALQNATAQLQTNFDLAEMPSRKAGFVSAGKDPFGTASDPWKKIGHLFEAQPVQVDISPILPAIQQTITAYQQLKPLVLDVVDVTARLVETNQMVAKAATQATETQAQAFQRLTNEGKQATSKMNETLKGLAQQAKDVFGDAFGALFTEGFQGFKDRLLQGFSQMLQQLASQLAQSVLGGLLKKVLGGLFGGGGGIGDFISDAFGGFRAEGGPVSAGMAYIVGERRPEIFVPKTDGMILPSTAGFGSFARAGGGGQPINVVNNFHISAPTGTISQKSQRQVAAEAGYAITKALERNRR